MVRKKREVIIRPSVQAATLQYSLMFQIIYYFISNLHKPFLHSIYDFR